MLLYAVCLLLLPDTLSKSLVSHVSAAPATYDQRQNGDLNVDAKFENFLIIVATSGTGNLFNNLATQALELNELISLRSKNQEKPSETLIYETEDASDGKQPYHVEIVHLNTNDSKQSVEKKTSDESKSGTPSEDPENSEKTTETSTTEVYIDGKKGSKRTRSLWKNERLEYADGSIKENKKIIEKKNSQTKILDQPDVLFVKEEALRAARPGISLKKQLSKKEEENASSASEEKNELGINYQELVLLGDGIENCGPGRYRDKSGVCQTDENFQ